MHFSRFHVHFFKLQYIPEINAYFFEPAELILQLSKPILVNHTIYKTKFYVENRQLLTNFHVSRRSLFVKI